MPVRCSKLGSDGLGVSALGWSKVNLKRGVNSLMNGTLNPYAGLV